MFGCKQWNPISSADMSAALKHILKHPLKMNTLQFQENVKRVYLQTGVPRSSPISWHRAKVFTGLLVGNKLLSEMKVQLQPYETECPD